MHISVPTLLTFEALVARELVGTGATQIAQGDHTHPGMGDADYVNVIGDTMTGPLAVIISGMTATLNGNSLQFDRPSTNYIDALNASGAIAFRTGGTNVRMSIEADGSIGLGGSAKSILKIVTSAPARTQFWAYGDRLDVLTAAGSAYGSMTCEKVYGNNNASKHLYLESTRDATKGYVIVQPNGGYVGIGTSTPTTMLTVAGGILGTTLNIVDGASIIGRTSGSRLRIYNQFGVSLAYYNGSTIVESMYADANGRVGIGTLVPNYKLTITDGSTPETSSAGLPNDRTFSIQGAGSTHMMIRDVTNDIELAYGTSSLLVGYIGSMTAHDLQIRVNNATAIHVQTATKRVGIGTVSPTDLLNIKSQGYNGATFAVMQAATDNVRIIQYNEGSDGSGWIRINNNVGEEYIRLFAGGVSYFTDRVAFGTTGAFGRVQIHAPNDVYAVLRLSAFPGFTKNVVESYVNNLLVHRVDYTGKGFFSALQISSVLDVFRSGTDTIVDVLNVADFLRFRFAGTNRFSISQTGYMYGQGFVNSSTGNNSAVYVTTNGTEISRNIADEQYALLVRQYAAGTTGDILRLANSAGDVVNFKIDGAAEFPKVKLTVEGGIAVKMTNKTGSASVKGSLISASTTVDNSFILQSNEYDTMGVVYQDGVADGSECWIVVSGIAEVLMKDGVTPTRGDILIAADTNGRADRTANPGSGLPAVDTHFKECGHLVESKVAGTSVLAKAVIHFN